MRLKRLELNAFGHFTDQTLEFNYDVPGFHIIFGPNEAGKSSSLRALKALLYGFPQQTPDNFLHSYDQLLVGGCLENMSGEEIVFQRRKKRISDLMDKDGNPLDAGALYPFLLGLEPEIFESLYGIDHETLVRGGEEILAQKGEVGQALFAAGAGISSLREVISQLDQDGADLFKPAGQKPEINAALKRFKELKKQAKQLSLSSRDWKIHHKALETAIKERDDLEKDRNHKNKELMSLERLNQAIPELAIMQSWQDQLTALGQVVHLPPDFVELHRQVSEKIRSASQQLERDRDLLEKLESKCRAISFNPALLDHAELVDDFHQRLGEYRKGQKDRPERNGMRISLKRDAAHMLLQVRPDLNLEDVETLRPVLTRKRTIHTLSSQYESISQQLILADNQRMLADQELEDVEKGLATMGFTLDAQKLARAVKLAQKAGDMDAQLEKSRTDFEMNQKKCLDELKQLGLWTGDFNALMELSLPLSETVQEFLTNYNRVKDEFGSLEKDCKKEEKELKKALADIKKAASGGQLPSEDDLAKIRERRKQGWQLLRRQWIDQEDVTEKGWLYDPDQPLVDAYEGVVDKADRIADRLRWEADRVANVAGFRVQVEILEGSLAENEREKKACDLKVQKLDKSWNLVWQPLGIVPLSPKEMAGWLTRMDKLRFKVGDLLKKNQEIQQNEEQRKELCKAVEKELCAMGHEDIPDCEKLGPVLIMAEDLLEKIGVQNNTLEKLKDRQKNAQKAFSKAGLDFDGAQKALEKWKDQWKKAVSGLGLEDEVSTVEAIDLVEILKNCFDKLKEADDLKKRIAGIDRDAADLEKELKALLENIGPDLLALPLDQAILQLRNRLGQAQKDRALFDKLSEELGTLQEKVVLAEKSLNSATAQMEEFLKIAGCEKSEELPPVIQRHMEYQTIKEKLSNTRATLAKIGAGIPIELLVTRAKGMNVDELPGQIESLKRDIQDRINLEINEISQAIGQEKALLAAMDGNDQAAQTAEKMEQELAGIRRLVDRYVQVKLAAKILHQEIERYREEHQDPVLKIASGYFSRLTLGSFTGLRTDVDDRGAPVLVGLRPARTPLTAAGRLTVDKMSSGTRDQLYLALRLATLEWRLEVSEPMPFIVDDILINFDDDRSRATLAVLADLSKKNQVILFTHHRQIVEEAKNLDCDGGVYIHKL